MESYGIVEVVCTGLSAIERGEKSIKNREENEED